MDHLETAERNLLFKCVTGSRAYGTSTPTSDLDVRGVFAADPISVITPWLGVDQVQGPGDTVLYELSRYVKLVCGQSPNIVELLWIDPSDILFEHPAWSELRAIRGSLLTTKVRATYGGFATQALKGMRGHERWLNNPQPERPPLPRDFASMVHNIRLPRSMDTVMPAEGAWTAVGCGQDVYLLFEGGSGSWFDANGNLRHFSKGERRAASDAEPSAVFRFDRKKYDEAKRDHENYWMWRRNRNKARGALEEEMGYDGKNVGHVMRLLRTAHEILTEGVVRVRRPDAEELLAYRTKKFPLERILAEADRLEGMLAEAEASSRLPRTIDEAEVARVVMRMYERVWSKSPRPRSGHNPAERRVGPPDLSGRVVVFDLEMTGFAEAGRRQIVEVAAVEIEGGRATGRTFHSYVNPETHLNRVAGRIHGLTPGFLASKPTFGEVAPLLLDFIADAPLLSHRAETDMRALNNDLVLAGFEPLPPGRAACTERIARQLLGGVTLSLDSLCDAFGIDRSARARGHTGPIDAALLCECVLAMGGMPGYSDVTDGVWMRRQSLVTRAERRRRGISGDVGRCVGVEISRDAGTADFLHADGRRTAVALPSHPRATHEVVAHPSGALLVRRLDGPLDNPEGPAVVFMTRGVLGEAWFSDGVRVAPSTADAPSP